jgi:hypothetical protein
MKHQLRKVARRGGSLMPVAIAGVLIAPAVLINAQQQAAAPRNATSASVTVSKTADGQPNIEGVWNKSGGGLQEANPPKTPLSRPEFTRAYPTVFTAGQPGGPPAAAPPRRPTGVVDPADKVLPWRPGEDERRREYLSHMHPPQSLDYIQMSTRCALPGPWIGGEVMILQPRGKVVMLFQTNDTSRSIPVDGRPRLKSDVKLFMGDPVGRWEGNTLVVETTNLNGKVEFGVFPTIVYLSDALRVTERFTIVDADTIDYEIIYNDPKLFSRPIKSVGYLARSEKGATVMEYACAPGSYALENIFGF